MRANKLFQRKRAKNGSGRTVKIKHILLPEEVAEDLRLYRDCYTQCLDVKVSFEQMLRRWMDNIGRIDPDVARTFREFKESQQESQARLAAGLGLTSEQLTANEAAFDPTALENEPWKLSYFFEKDGEQVEALPGVYTPFYGTVNGQNLGMAKLLAAGWTLQNEVGVELDLSQAQKICALIKEHQNKG